jgi:uncharacterized protein with GYD domain
MPQYVLLMNLTESGVEALKPAENSEGGEFASFEESLAAQIALLEGDDGAAGGGADDGGLQALFWTLGGYDVVAIADLESDLTAAAIALWLAQTHGVRTTTLPAFTKADVTPGEDGDSLIDSLYRCHFGARLRRTEQ